MHTCVDRLSGRPSVPSRRLSLSNRHGASDGFASNPGIDSSLSNVPPVTERRPVIIGTVTPQAAAIRRRSLMFCRRRRCCAYRPSSLYRRKIQNAAGIAHRRVNAGLFDVHSIQIDGHQPGCDVIVRDFEAVTSMKDSISLRLTAAGFFWIISGIDHSREFWPARASALPRYHKLLSIV
jgi:hypothetical protein